MRVPVRRMLMLGLAGAVMTLVIAWTLAKARPLPRDWPGLFAIDRRGEYWMAHGKSGPGWSHLTLYGAAGLTDVGRDMASTLPSWIEGPCDGPVQSRCLSVIGAGWPMTAFRGECVGLGHDEPPPGGAWHSGLGPQWIEWQPWRGALGVSVSSPAFPSTQTPLPTGIIWRGAILDTLFWSLVFASPMLLLSARRALRRWRGRCPACGYDLRRTIHEGCPECGWLRDDVRPT